LEEDKTQGLQNNTVFSGGSFDNSLSMQTIDQRGIQTFGGGAKKRGPSTANQGGPLIDYHQSNF
jgi:hypothetical protein